MPSLFSCFSSIIDEYPYPVQACQRRSLFNLRFASRIDTRPARRAGTIPDLSARFTPFTGIEAPIEWSKVPVTGGEKITQFDQFLELFSVCGVLGTRKEQMASVSGSGMNVGAWQMSLRRVTLTPGPVQFQ